MLLCSDSASANAWCAFYLCRMMDDEKDTDVDEGKVNLALHLDGREYG